MPRREDMTMARTRHIDVILTDEETAFLKWLAERDGVTFKEEMRMLFELQLSEEFELYNAERLQEIEQS